MVESEGKPSDKVTFTKEPERMKGECFRGKKKKKWWYKGPEAGACSSLEENGGR